MIKVLGLNHVAIACKDAKPLAAFFRDILGMRVSASQPQPEHGVYTTFVGPGGAETGATMGESPMAKIELIEPLGPDSPIAKFVDRYDGSVHHFCFEVEDLEYAVAQLRLRSIQPLFPPRIGAHGLPIVFLHPRDCCGLLVELEQRAGRKQ